MNFWLLFALPAMIPLLITSVNLLTWRRGRVSASRPQVSVLIPARNEERNIESCVRSVLKAEGSRACVKEILVYDDLSEDRTGELVEALSQVDDRVRLIAGSPLPIGWVGKPHACERLLQQAAGDVLLYLDADVCLEGQGLLRLVSFLDTPVGARLVTAVPRQITGSAFERLVIPLLTLTYAAWLPLRLVEYGRRATTVAANGQLVMISRRDALSLGGFESVRCELVDDIAFARRAKERGYRVAFADGYLTARCRMYRSASQVWRGFSKNLYEGLGANPLSLGLAVGLYLACFVVPYVGLALALLPDGMHRHLLPAASAGVAANVLLRFMLALRYRQPPLGILLHPISVLALVAIAINSARWAVLGRNSWAGRCYPGRQRRVQTSQGDTPALSSAGKA